MTTFLPLSVALFFQIHSRSEASNPVPTVPTSGPVGVSEYPKLPSVPFSPPLPWYAVWK